MRMYDIIEKKKRGGALDRREIEYFVKGATDGSIPDYQISALLMAIFFKGMSPKETFELTMAMAASGDMLDLSAIEGIKVDKHSTGGVGDKTTFVIAPMIAALGLPFAKMSGRGLGHTGGTIDKLEAFPGFRTSISETKFFDNVARHKIAVVGQTKNLAPCDKKLYALRDATATVDQISLIASSIMSKKLASGADAIVLDVKVGSGAFMKTKEDARLLAQTMVDIGNSAGKKVTAVLTDMDEPLGYAVGNTLEVIEAIDALRGEGPADLMEVVFALGCQLALLSGVAANRDEALEKLNRVIDDGSAYDKFVEFIRIQNGNPEDVPRMRELLNAAYVEDIFAENDGFVSKINAEGIGHASMVLGGGRAAKEDSIDLNVGVVLHKKVGDSIIAGESIATIFGNDERKMQAAKDEVLASYQFTKNKVDRPAKIIEIIGEQ